MASEAIQLIDELIGTLSTRRTKTTVSWTEIKPAPADDGRVPCARSSHGVSFVGGASPRLVIYGGEAVARTPIDPAENTWIADYSAKSTSWKWRAITSGQGVSKLTPPPRLGHAQAVINNKVYVFGGRMGIQMHERALNDLWVLDASGAPGTEAWSQVQYAFGDDSAGVAPVARSFHKMVAVGADLYVFGGCSAGGRLADLHRFDTATNTWTDLGASQVLKGRGGANLIVLKGKRATLAVVAGFDGGETNDGHVFCGAWAKEGMRGLEDMRPRSVCVAASVASQGVAVIFGGEVDPSERGHEGAGGFASDVVILDGENGALRESVGCVAEAEWPEARGWSDGDVGEVGSAGTCLFVFGGLSGDDKEPRRLGDLWQCEIGVQM